MHRVLWFDEDERDMFELLIKSARRQQEIYHQAHDEFRERELDKAILFVQLILKEGIII